MADPSGAMQACLDACFQCYRTCLGMASNHCLEAGGCHVEPEHFRLMLDCAEACRACKQECRKMAA